MINLQVTNIVVIASALIIPIDDIAGSVIRHVTIHDGDECEERQGFLAEMGV